MTLGEFREQTKNLSDDLTLEIYTERYNDSTQPIRLEFDTEGYIEFIINDDRWDLVGNKAIPLDKVKQAREEMEDKSCYGCLQIMDKLIAESEE